MPPSTASHSALLSVALLSAFFLFFSDIYVVSAIAPGCASVGLYCHFSSSVLLCSFVCPFSCEIIRLIHMLASSPSPSFHCLGPLSLSLYLSISSTPACTPFTLLRYSLFAFCFSISSHLISLAPPAFSTVLSLSLLSVLPIDPCSNFHFASPARSNAGQGIWQSILWTCLSMAQETYVLNITMPS